MGWANLETSKNDCPSVCLKFSDLRSGAQRRHQKLSDCVQSLLTNGFLLLFGLAVRGDSECHGLSPDC